MRPRTKTLAMLRSSPQKSICKRSGPAQSARVWRGHVVVSHLLQLLLNAVVILNVQIGATVGRVDEKSVKVLMAGGTLGSAGREVQPYTLNTHLARF